MTDPVTAVPPEAVTAIALIVPSPAELQEEIIRILRDHLTAAPPRSVDDDDLQVTAISIIDSVQDVVAAAVRAQVYAEIRQQLLAEADRGQKIGLDRIAMRAFAYRLSPDGNGGNGG